MVEISFSSSCLSAANCSVPASSSEVRDEEPEKGDGRRVRECSSEAASVVEKQRSNEWVELVADQETFIAERITVVGCCRAYRQRQDESRIRRLQFATQEDSGQTTTTTTAQEDSTGNNQITLSSSSSSVIGGSATSQATSPTDEMTISGSSSSVSASLGEFRGDVAPNSPPHSYCRNVISDSLLRGFGKRREAENKAITTVWVNRTGKHRFRRVMDFLRDGTIFEPLCDWEFEQLKADGKSLALNCLTSFVEEELQRRRKAISQTPFRCEILGGLKLDLRMSPAWFSSPHEDDVGYAVDPKCLPPLFPSSHVSSVSVPSDSAPAFLSSSSSLFCLRPGEAMRATSCSPVACLERRHTALCGSSADRSLASSVALRSHRDPRVASSSSSSSLLLPSNSPSALQPIQPSASETSASADGLQTTTLEGAVSSAASGGKSNTCLLPEDAAAGQEETVSFSPSSSLTASNKRLHSRGIDLRVEASMPPKASPVEKSPTAAEPLRCASTVSPFSLPSASQLLLASQDDPDDFYRMRAALSNDDVAPFEEPSRFGFDASARRQNVDLGERKILYFEDLDQDF